MPEGPEISIIADILDTKCMNQTIKKVTIHEDSRYKSGDKRFIYLLGLSIKMISFKGKKIIFSLNDDSYLLSSLGLEGRWLFSETPIKNSKHLSVSFEFDSGKSLGFWDQRHFGSLEFCEDYYVLEKKLKAVGTPWIPSELFPEKLTKDELFEHLSSKKLYRKKIMEFLMDQKYTSGVGNYIRAECLYMAHINPHRLVNTITREESDLLYSKCMNIMAKAMKLGGHTLKSYINPSGETGGYIPQVYGRKLSLTKKEDIIREKDSQGRSIFWVPSVQA